MEGLRESMGSGGSGGASGRWRGGGQGGEGVVAVAPRRGKSERRASEELLGAVEPVGVSGEMGAEAVEEEPM
ncbi:hypothetical protein Syun_005332 [Stephania yunnanensis]|uniref:Uncharacterized protein n=1 Tax=Stephania yunnanensis TaxID=152371 RepID=A0AAP0L768_9MAGN